MKTERVGEVWPMHEIEELKFQDLCRAPPVEHLNKWVWIDTRGKAAFFTTFSGANAAATEHPDPKTDNPFIRQIGGPGFEYTPVREFMLDDADNIRGI